MTKISWRVAHAGLPKLGFPVPSASSLPHRCVGSMEIPPRFSRPLSQAKPLDGSVSVQEPSSCFPGQLNGSLSCHALEKLRD